MNWFAVGFIVMISFGIGYFVGKWRGHEQALRTYRQMIAKVTRRIDEITPILRDEQELTAKKIAFEEYKREALERLEEEKSRTVREAAADAVKAYISAPLATTRVRLSVQSEHSSRRLLDTRSRESGSDTD